MKPYNSHFFDSIESAIEDIRQGKMVIVVDDEDRENEGDFIMAADKVTPKDINFMAKYGRGIICTPITQEMADRLDLPPMARKNTANHHTAFTISIDINDKDKTGVSASDRAETTLKMLDPNSTPDDFICPGHTFPLVAKDGGVEERPGHTEAAVDLAKLAGLSPAGVICEVLNEDGSMARLPRLRELSELYDLKLISIDELIRYKQEKKLKFDKTETINFPTKFGDFNLHLFENRENKNDYHVMITKGDLNKAESPLIRIHSECFTGDLFGSLRCDCGDQLKQAMNQIENEGVGAVIYLRQEGRGIGLNNKIKAYKLQEEGHDTISANNHLGFAADERDFAPAAKILKECGLSKVRLMTNNPDKIEGLKREGIEVQERIASIAPVTNENYQYLQTKKEKMGHLFEQLLH